MPWVVSYRQSTSLLYIPVGEKLEQYSLGISTLASLIRQVLDDKPGIRGNPVLSVVAAHETYASPVPLLKRQLLSFRQF